MKTKKQLCIMLMVNILVLSLWTSLSTVSATENTKDATIPTIEIDEIFPEDEIMKSWEIASNLPVETDPKTLLRSVGTYPTRKGVILVTNDKFKGIIPTGHAAIIYSNSQVVEALTDGVKMGKNNWNTSKTTCIAVTTKGTTTTQDSSVADWCKAQVGKPYNWTFFGIEYTDSFYCSHLIYKGYKTKTGIDLNTSAYDAYGGRAIHPSELVLTDKTTKIYEK